MKRMLVLLLAAILCLCLAACSKDPERNKICEKSKLSRLTQKKGLGRCIREAVLPIIAETRRKALKNTEKTRIIAVLQMNKEIY